MTSTFFKFWGPTAFLNKTYYHEQLPLLLIYIVTMFGSRIDFKEEKREHFLSSVQSRLIYSCASFHMPEAYCCSFTHLTSAVPAWNKQMVLLKHSKERERVGSGRLWLISSSGTSSRVSMRCRRRKKKETNIGWARSLPHVTLFNYHIPGSWYY